MHEWSLMVALREQVLERAAAAGAIRVDRITLRIGTLAGVDAHALRLVHDAAMAGSIAAASELAIEVVMAQAFCASCQAPFPAQHGWCECPRCGAISQALLCGRELDLIAVDLICDVPKPLPACGSPACPAPGIAAAQQPPCPRQQAPVPSLRGAGDQPALGPWIGKDGPAGGDGPGLG
jgi:hydrogenase nickel incorporation protein HypA/HybF